MAKFKSNGNSQDTCKALVKYIKRRNHRQARRCQLASKEAVAEMIWRGR